MPSQLGEHQRLTSTGNRAAGTRPLHLLIVGASWPAETFLAQLIRGLLDCRVELTVVTRDRPDESWFSSPGFHWVRTPEGSRPARALRLARDGARALLRAPRDVRGLASRLRGGKSPLTRLHEWSLTLPFAGGRWDVIYFPWNEAAIACSPLFELGPPVVLSCRGYQINVAPHNPDRAALRDGLPSSFRKAAAVHCVSRAIRKEATRYGLDPVKARVIHPSVDSDFFRPGESGRRANAPFRIVTTGSLSWRKGYEDALLAVRHLADMGVRARFAIIGDGPDHRRILYTVEDLRLEGQVKLLGHLPSERVRAELVESDVFLLSSYSEGISNAALEGMSCGLPVVTTDCGGMREAVTDGVEGYVVPVREPEAIAGALRQLAASPGQREKMGCAARAKILSSFQLKQQIQDFIRLFSDVARRAAA